jgi:hypothetical protein
LAGPAALTNPEATPMMTPIITTVFLGAIYAWSRTAWLVRLTSLGALGRPWRREAITPFDVRVIIGKMDAFVDNLRFDLVPKRAVGDRRSAD